MLVKLISVIAVPSTATTAEAFATIGAIGFTVISTVAVSFPVTFVAVTV